MTLQQIRYAIAVKEELSFIRAAEKCHVSQPSLSVQIKNLETELNIMIFDRSRSSQVTITPIGEALLNRLKSILSDLQNTVDEIKSYQSSPFGTLKVGIIPTICPYIMPILLKHKNKYYPNLNLEIYENTTDSILRLIKSGQLECGILSTPQKTPVNLTEHLLYYEPFVLYASSEHPLLDKERVSSLDLTKFEVSMLDETHCMRDQVLAACKLKNKENKHQQSKLVSGSLQTLVTIVDETKSFSLIPIMAADFLHFKHPKSGIRKIVNPTPTRKVSLIFNKHYERKNLMSALVKCITSDLPSSVMEHASAATKTMPLDRKRFDF